MKRTRATLEAQMRGNISETEEDLLARLHRELEARVHSDILGSGILTTLLAIAAACDQESNRSSAGRDGDRIAKQIFEENLEFCRDAAQRIRKLCQQMESGWGERMPQMGDGDVNRFPRRHQQLTAESATRPR